MWFARERSPVPVVEKGACFRRLGAWRIVETVKILAVASDASGVPHVRFSLEMSGQPTLEEQRTLSLESFKALYSDAVGATA